MHKRFAMATMLKRPRFNAAKIFAVRLNIVVIWAMILSIMPIVPHSAQAAEDFPYGLVPATDVEAVPHSVSRDNGVDALKASARQTATGSTTTSTYIIQLVEQPVALYEGGVANLRPTSPKVTGAAKLDMASPEVQEYSAHLSSSREAFIAKMNETLGREVSVEYEYFATLNGMAVELTVEEAVTVGGLPNVRFIEQEQMYELQTFAGPEWMGADEIWSGMEGIPGTQGEGIIVGIIDTGINPTNPSFAATGDDGYTHTNPYGAGNYVGVCNPAEESYDPTIPCNDKLIGIWGYPSADPSPVDTDGHGSHTASTAAGNVVNADKAIVTTDSGFSIARTISGVAPHANIIAYDGCSDGGGCPGAALTASRDQALIDGVDVINYSIGGGSTPDPWNDAEAIQWLALRTAGVFVATSAGNSGNSPETVGSPGDIPWITTVGASTHDVAYLTSLVEMAGGDTAPPADILGRGTSTGYGPAPIVYAGDYGDAICENPFEAGTFNGEIVVCDRGVVARKAKGANVLAGGAGGMVLAEVDTPGIGAVLVDTHVLPAVHITKEDGDALKAWLASGSGHTGRITATVLDQNDSNGDIMAKFSSRGPNAAIGDIIVPNITAPGVGIFAAYAVGVEFDVIQGTSMSSPHAAGAGALMKAVHPDWSPAEIESALMTTANTNVRDDDGVSQAPYWAMGSGRVDLPMAAKAGLTLDETQAGYLAANPAEGGDPSQINLASMGEDKCLANCGWSRTVTNRMDSTGTWDASVMGDEGLTLGVEPTSFTLAPGESQTLNVSAASGNLANGEWATGVLYLTEQSGAAPEAHLPIAVQNTFGILPDEVSINARRNAGSIPIEGLEAIDITDLTIDIHGLVKGDRLTESLVSDPTNGDPYDGFSDPLVDGAFFVTVDVPEGTKRFIAETPPDGSESGDLDLFVGPGDTPSADTELCSSTSPTAIESCIFENPEPGTYWVLVQNWDPTNGDALPGESSTLDIVMVPQESAGNMSVEGPDAVPVGTPFDLRLFWDEPTMQVGDRWYGAISLGSDPANPGNIGFIPVTIIRVADDVSKQADTDMARVGDTVTFTIEVAPNTTPEDLNYTLVDMIPEGMTYVEGSATGGAIFDGTSLTWNINMPAGVAPEYIVSSNATDPNCFVPFGFTGFGYADLEAFGILANPGIFGDTQVFNAFTTGDPINFYGQEYAGVGITDDGFAIFDPASNYFGAPWIPQTIPSPDGPNNLAAPMWFDFEIFYDEALNHGVSLATAGPFIVIEYDDLQPFGGGPSILDMQIIMSRSANDAPGAYEIYYAYDNVNFSLPATVGTEDAFGENATALVNNDSTEGIIQSGTIVCLDLVSPAVVLTYQATIDVQPESEMITNVVVHETDNPGGMPGEASVDIAVPVPGVVIHESLGVSDIEEGVDDVPAGYTIRLKTPPTERVHITMEYDDSQIRLSRDDWFFTAETWDVPKQFKIYPVDDALYEGDHETLITHLVSSNDPYYSSSSEFTSNGPTAESDPSTVLVYITDNDSPEQTESTEPADSAESTEPADSGDSAESTEPTDSAESTEPASTATTPSSETQTVPPSATVEDDSTGTQPEADDNISASDSDASAIANEAASTDEANGNDTASQVDADADVDETIDVEQGESQNVENIATEPTSDGANEKTEEDTSEKAADDSGSSSATGSPEAVDAQIFIYIPAINQ